MNWISFHYPPKFFGGNCYNHFCFEIISWLLLWPKVLVLQTQLISFGCYLLTHLMNTDLTHINDSLNFLNNYITIYSPSVCGLC